MEASMLKMRHVMTALLIIVASAGLLAQAKPEFDVVSIKRHAGTDPNVNMRSSPDGTTMMTNVSISLVLTIAAPVPLRDIIGLPDWVNTERYDIAVKAPASAMGLDQRRARWRAVFAERMKLVAHEEQREKDAFSLMLARKDGRFGPQLTPSTLDCTSPARPAGPAAQPPMSIQYFHNRCTIGSIGNTFASGSIQLDQLASFLGDQAGGDVVDGTGLKGRYAFVLKFSRQSTAGPAVETAPVDDAPDLFTAVQEQLGLKLQHEKKMTTVFVIDHIERPTEN